MSLWQDIGRELTDVTIEDDAMLNLEGENKLTENDNDSLADDSTMLCTYRWDRVYRYGDVGIEGMKAFGCSMNAHHKPKLRSFAPVWARSSYSR